MKIETIKDILIARGYNEQNAAIASNELSKISEELSPLLSQWLDNGSFQKDYSAHGYSIGKLLKDGMTYPAALLTMDWLLKEPENALRSLTKGNR